MHPKHGAPPVGLHRPYPSAHPHSLFLVQPRPRRSAVCPRGSAAFSARLWRCALSEALPWEDTDEADSVHEAYSAGSFESGTLGFLLAKEQNVRWWWRNAALRALELSAVKSSAAAPAPVPARWGPRGRLPAGLGAAAPNNSVRVQGEVS